MKNGTDNRSNPIYKQDEAGFLLANFRHLLHEFDEPFFSFHKFNRYFSRVSQRHLGGKLYLGRSLKVDGLLQTCMMITLKCMVFVSRLEVPLDFLDLESSRTLVGAIELNREDILLDV